MKAKIDHVSINVSNLEESKQFYEEFFSIIRWKKFREEKETVSWADKDRKFFVWLNETEDKFKINGFHRKNTGVNHICFMTESKEEVDEFYKNFLLGKKRKAIYGEPKEYPKYEKGYYAVFFEDPDRIKLEVMFVPA